MKKILLIIGIILLVGCYFGNRSYSSDSSNSEDSVEVDTMVAPTTTQEEIVEKNYKPDSYPDSIRIAFTRNGEFVDSFTVYRIGGIYDKNDKFIGPKYYFRDAVGHMWFYDIHGKFIDFIESPYPHDGADKEEPYKP